MCLFRGEVSGAEGLGHFDVFAGDHDGADEGDGEEDAGEFEGEGVLGVEAVPDVLAVGGLGGEASGLLGFGDHDGAVAGDHGLGIGGGDDNHAGLRVGEAGDHDGVGIGGWRRRWWGGFGWG